MAGGGERQSVVRGWEGKRAERRRAEDEETGQVGLSSGGAVARSGVGGRGIALSGSVVENGDEQVRYSKRACDE
ncbi:hypothetical protein GUJ93_ZPchr0001g31021 [Zizania palustris]|uniref:Uncharacterized protein n=1 Tax=Zizania palustris TaxID=103762 RepID=A0A8J5VSJ7_ZIZPA|nr:hypothetical protein GUJ93_ZPchr0001g31021 [Zizania palustris]